MQKRGYFFTLDAFVAVVILVIGILIILSAQSFKPYETQTLFISEDVMAYLSGTNVQEINEPYINELRSNGTIKNFDSTLIEQAGEFYANNDKQAAAELIKAAIKSIIPPQFGYQILINNELIRNESVIPEDTKVLASSKAIVYGLSDSTKLWGPYTAEVRAWQK